MSLNYIKMAKILTIRLREKVECRGAFGKFNSKDIINIFTFCGSSYRTCFFPNAFEQFYSNALAFFKHVCLFSHFMTYVLCLSLF